MIFSISLYQYVWAILLVTFTAFFTLYIATPLVKIYPYKRRGDNTYFFPVLGIFSQLATDFRTKGDVLASSRESSKQYKNNSFVVSNLTSNLLISLRDPQYIKEFVQKQHLYTKANFMGLISMLGTGLIMAEGETWKRHRKIISNSFHFDFLKSHVGLIQKTARQFFDRLTQEDYKDYTVLDRMQELTGEVVGLIFFGENLSSYRYQGKSLTMALGGVMEELGICGKAPLVVIFGLKALDLPIFPRYQRLLRNIEGIRSLCHKIIQDRKAQSVTKDDLLSALLATQLSQDPEQRFSDEDIINEFITFFVAGMDSTGHLISMSLYMLTQHPHYLESLREERNSAYIINRPLTTDSLQKMNLLHAFFKETLRFYTPAPGFFPRQAVTDHKLLDLPIRKGTILRFVLFAIFFNEKYFVEAQKFSPERWMTSNPTLDPYAFTPFSAGPRNCIGQHLAIMEAKIIVSEFLERFDFKLKEDYKLKMTYRLTYEPYDPLLFNLSPKNV